MPDPQQTPATETSPEATATATKHDTPLETASTDHTEAVEPAKSADPADSDDRSQGTATKEPSEDRPARSRSSSVESGEASPPREATDTVNDSAPPLPNEAPPLPAEAPPPAEDDGWDFHWSDEAQAYYFYNRLTGATTWENPRTATDNTAAPQGGQAQSASTATAPPLPASDPDALPAGGYNPAIHGDYDPNAWYAQKPATSEPVAAPGAPLGDGSGLAAMGSFNRFTGAWQAGGDELSNRHNDENKSHRQMNAYFDVDAVASTHDGRSLKAERSGKKPSKAELKTFKEKRKARKEEKRRAWLRD
ncbi:hypothetical protein Micbo1qcDRAFT_159731 [Microdochium bolleyi]|uniref:WW domain-containing protein n=1 Tax=Microdochium bolleyi TaxID=196109 RepID=A0A136JBK4_9PEZI|nr:hypothetical protein Micbo1qcDRAFT_159731 [Microdochium bolleyi]